jgi:transposase InsO family protein
MDPVRPRVTRDVFAFLEANRNTFPVSLMCRRFGVTRAGFYAWRNRPPSARIASDAAMTERVLEVFREAKGLYGSPRVTRQLGIQGVSVGRRRVARLMRLAQLQGRSARLYRRSRVGQNKFYRGHPNTIHGLTTNRPNQLWVGDVTYVRVAGRWRYLAVVMDRHSRRVLGWSLGRNRDALLTRRALAHAVRWRRPSPGAIFHSDRGIEYAAFELGRALSRLGFLQSMNRPRQMNDNAHMESFFHSLKTEWLFGMTFPTENDLRAALSEYVRFYNQKRLHSSLGYLPPAVFEARVPIHTGVN